MGADTFITDPHPRFLDTDDTRRGTGKIRENGLGKEGRRKGGIVTEIKEKKKKFNRIWRVLYGSTFGY